MANVDEHAATAPPPPPNTDLACQKVVVRRQGIGHGLVALGLILLVLGLPVGGVFLGWLGVAAAAAAAVASFIKAGRVMAKETRGGSVRLVDGAVLLTNGASGEVRTVPLSAIESGFEAPTERAVVLTLRDGSQLRITLEQDMTARVLAHAGVGTTQRSLTLPLRRMLGAFTIGFVAFWPLLVGSLMLMGNLAFVVGFFAGPLAMALAAVLTSLVVLRLGFPRVVVGTDGIRLLGVLRPRFVPHEAIAGVEVVSPAYAGGPTLIRVRRHDGSALALPTIAAPTERIEGLARRIREAVQAHSAGGALPLDTLARGGRSLEEWKTDVARIALAPPGFRDHALGRDDFERVLADAAAPPEQRIGAALALRAVDPGEGAARIRVAAEASADDALREALALAAAGEVDESVLTRASARKAPR